MKNYSEMSDFEVNKAVAVALGYPEKDCDYGWTGKPSVGVEWNEETGYPTKSFDFCNSWADAGPIIHGKRIMLNPYCADQLWKAEHEVMDDGFMKTYAVNYDKNPLRAAMIVFLMMQESK